jgi:hypothetical protein
MAHVKVFRSGFPSNDRGDSVDWIARRLVDDEGDLLAVDAVQLR